MQTSTKGDIDLWCSQHQIGKREKHHSNERHGVSLHLNILGIVQKHHAENRRSFKCLYYVQVESG